MIKLRGLCATFLLFVFLLSTNSVALGSNSVSESEREGLLAIYNSLNGENWSGLIDPWPVDVEGDECSWDNIVCECDNEICTVTELYFNGTYVYGSIPDDIGLLTNLEILDIHSSNINGAINSNIGNLSNLKHLRISSNWGISGTIPESFGNLVNLETLTIQDNPNLIGSLPGSFANLTSLKRLKLRGNGFNEGLPSVLGQMTNLEWLALTGNPLGGDLPTWIGELVNLKKLDLRGTAISGEIPASILNLINLEDNNLFLAQNGLYTNNPAISDFLFDKSAFVYSYCLENECEDKQKAFDRSQALDGTDISVTYNNDIAIATVTATAGGGDRYIVLKSDSVDGEYEFLFEESANQVDINEDNQIEIGFFTTQFESGEYYIKVVSAFDEIEMPVNELTGTPYFVNYGYEDFETNIFTSYTRPHASFQSSGELSEVGILITTGEGNDNTEGNTQTTQSSGGSGGGGSFGIHFLFFGCLLIFRFCLVQAATKG